MNESQVPSPIAEIVGWDYSYEFTGTGPDQRVDIDLRLTFRKFDETIIIAGASLFAGGDTTPKGLISAGPGEYTVTLPIRGFAALRWSPFGVSGAQKRYLVNFKLTSVPEDEDDDPVVYDFRGVTVGFRDVEPVGSADDEALQIRVNADTFAVKPFDWAPDVPDVQARKQLLSLRDSGVNTIRVDKVTSDAVYGICDELGLLVWQIVGDDSPAALSLVRSHPCLVLWSAHNSSAVIPDGILGQPGPVAAWV